MIKETRHIDLHLPTGWNQATTEELEHIAAAIIYAQQRQDRYHPFDWAQVKLMAVLAINGLEVVSQPVPVIQDYSHDDTYLLRRDKEEPFPISVGQLCDLCSHLDWIEDPKPRYPLFHFPYKEITVGANGMTLTLQGPIAMLDGYSWQEYRWLTDWMPEYLRAVNGKRDASNAECQFLSILFRAEQTINDKIKELEAEAELKGDDFPKKQRQELKSLKALVKDPAVLFSDFSPVKWQVILFWWSALMLQLERKFPKVFKQQPVGKRQRQQKADTPWDFYNRVIATIQKYVGGLSEQDVNTASYGTILQQLDMMAREAEEMERLNKKYKK